jgi:hypothetical protein
MQTLLVEVFGPLAIAFVLLIAVSGFRRLLRLRQRQSPEAVEAARDAFRNRLVHPKPEEVEQRIGGRLPKRLLTLYQDHPLILTEEIEIRRPSSDGGQGSEWIEAFLPLDLESQKYTVDLSVYGPDKGFCFATDGAGNFYWVAVSETTHSDAPVFFACHDPFGNEQVAASLEEFLSWPRKVRAAHAKSASS